MFTKRNTMDTQFNTLTRSYHDNYIQYKITGSQTYQTAYQAAEQGLQTILNSLQDQVTQQQSQISDFYKGDVEGKLRDTQSDMKKYQRKIVKTEDAIEAAKIRSEAPPASPPPQTPLMGQYIALSILGVLAFGLMALR
jgi:peptidoglycan hydrolase CwlO-like protein